MKYDIYIEGHSASGSAEKASLFKSGATGDNFKDACKKALSDDPYYNKENNAYWGCRLFDNLEDAQKAFG